MTEVSQRALTPRGLRLRHIAELELRQPDWLVRGLIETDSLVLLIGEPSVGKSFFAFDLAACVATGTPWNGRRVKAGPALYIAGEGQSGLARRRAAWERHHGISLADAPLFVSTAPTYLTDDTAQAWLRCEVEQFQQEHGPPLLVVVDTLARNFGPGDENDTRDMCRAVTSLDTLRRLTGAATMVAHHTGHADKGRGRGSTVLRAAADTEMLLTRDASGVIHASVSKMKDAPAPPPMAFRLADVDLGMVDAEGEPIISAALVPAHAVQAPRTTPALGQNQKRALECLRGLAAASADTAPVTVKSWRDACGNAGIDRSRFAEVRKSLCVAGVIRLDDTSVWLCDSEESVRIAQYSDSRAAACESSDPPYKGDRTFAPSHIEQTAAFEHATTHPVLAPHAVSFPPSKHNGSHWHRSEKGAAYRAAKDGDV